MKAKTLILLFPATVFLTIALGKDPYERQAAIDVQHYTFRIELNDSTNRIAGAADVTILFRADVRNFFLDFGGRTKGEGMHVKDVQLGGQLIPFQQQGERLTISPATVVTAGQSLTFRIRYSGIPEDGLVIGRNKYEDRTFFADHWPDRGHLWLPCIDHPSDKATMEFIVVAPDHYLVIAPGLKQEETLLERHRKLTRYRESVPIAMKVTAVGVARFAVEESGAIDKIPQSTWVYPQNRDAGFGDFAVGRNIFTFYNERIGPYPYEKLAHVQSKTRWGGLENAGNIFYNEKAVTGQNTAESLIAHEMAHQWFGNSVTENDWHHVWLSEGFATYFADLYLESAYGPERLKEEMQEQRESVVAYYRNNPNPVVDTTITEIGKVLSTNTYAKAGWVLHMLRQQVGDEVFWKGIRAYYSRYRNANILTADFQTVMEATSGKKLSTFFNQWLFRGGHPRLAVTVSFRKGSSEATVVIEQRQEVPFQFPLDLQFNLADGQNFRQTVIVETLKKTIKVKLPGRPYSLELDPDVRLLHEASVRAK